MGPQNHHVDDDVRDPVDADDGEDVDNGHDDDDDDDDD